MATPITKPTYETLYRINKAGQRIAYRVLVREPPIINSYDDAVVHDQFKGDHAEGIWKGGVFSGLGYELVQAENLYKFRLKSGYGTIYGRQFEIEDDYDVDLSSLTGKNYCVVYVEINLQYVTKSFINIKLAHAGAGYPDIPTDDLVKTKQGVARMPLYRFIYKAAGSDRFTAVTCLFYTYGTGIAQKARSMDHDAVWNGRSVSNLFYYNADRFKKGTKAQYADLAKAIGTNGVWLASSDTMDLEPKSGSGAASLGDSPRNVLFVTKNIFRVTGRDVKTNIDSNKRYLVENQTYRFRSSDELNPIPKGAKVVGIIVEGYLKIYKWINSKKGWQPFSGNQYFSHQRKVWDYINRQGWISDGESHKLFSPILWNKNKTFEIAHLYKNQSIMGILKTTDYGQLISDGSVHGGFDDPYTPMEYSDTTCAELQFLDTESDIIDYQKPYIEVRVRDNFCIECDITFRLLYTGGTERWMWEYTDCWEIHKTPNPNPFSSLNPSLEGGQT